MIKNVQQVRKLPKVVRDFLIRTSPFKVHVGLNYDKYGQASTVKGHEYVAVMDSSVKGDQWNKDKAGQGIYFYGFGPSRKKALADLYTSFRYGRNLSLAIRAFTNRKKHEDELKLAVEAATIRTKDRLDKKYPSYDWGENKNSRRHKTEYPR